MYLAQDSSGEIYVCHSEFFFGLTRVGSSFNSSMLRQAQTHFEHALIQDPANEFAEIFIDKVGAWSLIILEKEILTT